MRQRIGDASIFYFIPRADAGGGQRYILALAREAKSRGIPVTVGCGIDGWLFEKLEAAGIPVVRFSYSSHRRILVRIAVFLYELHRYVRDVRPGIVHLHGSFSIIGVVSMVILPRKPNIVFTFGGMSFLSPGWEDWRTKVLGYALFRFLLPFVDRVIFVCATDYKRAAHIRLIKKTSRRVAIIPIGIDPNMTVYAKEHARNDLSARIGLELGARRIIGSIARFSYQKHIEFLIASFSHIATLLDDVVCIVLGYGDSELDLRMMIEKSGFSSRFFLVSGIEDAYRYGKAFDVFALTSRYEGMPYAVLEAMNAGVPVVSSSVGGIPELIYHGREGLLIGKKDTALFASHLQKLLQDVPYASRMGARAASRIAAVPYHEDAMNRATFAMYEFL